jgi:excisionase family DNA binding protein
MFYWVKKMETLTIEQAAQFLNCHKCTIMQKARSGQIPARKIGRRWVFVKRTSQPILLASSIIKPLIVSRLSSNQRLNYGNLQKRTNLVARFHQRKRRAHTTKLLARKTNAKRKNCTIALKTQSWDEAKLGARPRYTWQQAVVRYRSDEDGA